MNNMRKLYYSDFTTLDPAICPSSLETDNDGVPLLPFKGQPHIWDHTTDPLTCSECGFELVRCPDCFEYGGTHTRTSCTE